MHLKPYKVGMSAGSLSGYMNDPYFRDLDRSISHFLPLKMAMANKGAAVPEADLNYIHDRTWMSFYGEAIERGMASDEIMEVRTRFERDIWPELLEKFRNNAGSIQFLKEFAAWSPRLIQFLVDSWNHPGLAMLPARLLGHDPISDEIVVLMPNDALWPFCVDQTFRMISYRMDIEKTICERNNVRKVLMMGGGLLLSLLTGGYELGHDGQEVVVYDTDGDHLAPYMEQMLGGKPEDFGIHIVSDDFRVALNDPAQLGQYDAVLYGGVLTYNMAELEEIVCKSYALLASGGVFYGDLQIFGNGPDDAEPEGLAKLIYGFDGYVIHFPKMEILNSRSLAEAKMGRALQVAGFEKSKINFSTEPYDVNKGESPAGMITVATK